MKTAAEGQYTVAYLEGKLNANNADEFRQELEDIQSKAQGRIIVDLENLNYISSAGLRVLLTLQQNMEEKLTVRNVSLDIYEIFEDTGFSQIMDVQKRMRRLSVDGCKIIGQGAYGTVYRIDDETIVKVYDSPENLPVIKLEQERARQALVSGLPTAISFDIVRVGDTYGSVFELVDAQNLNDILLDNWDRAKELISEYAALLKKVHGVESASGDLPKAKDIFLDYADKLKGIISEDIITKVTDLIVKMKDDNHIVHGDIHMKNVLVENGKMILIDMETLSTGNAVFDLQGLYIAYRCYDEDEPDNCERFLGLSDERCDFIWKNILSCYFDGCSEEEIREYEKRIQVLAYFFFIYKVAVTKMSRPDLIDIRVEHSAEKLRKLLGEVGTLEI